MIMKNESNSEINDTLEIRYEPPVFEHENDLAAGWITIKSQINVHSELHENSLNFGFESSQLFYIKRYGDLMLLTDPETTACGYVYKK